MRRNGVYIFKTLANYTYFHFLCNINNTLALNISGTNIRTCVIWMILQLKTWNFQKIFICHLFYLEKAEYPYRIYISFWEIVTETQVTSLLALLPCSQVNTISYMLPNALSRKCYTFHTRKFHFCVVKMNNIGLSDLELLTYYFLLDFSW